MENGRYQGLKKDKSSVSGKSSKQIDNKMRENSEHMRSNKSRRSIRRGTIFDIQKQLVSIEELPLESQRPMNETRNVGEVNYNVHKESDSSSDSSSSSSSSDSSE